MGKAEAHDMVLKGKDAKEEGKKLADNKETEKAEAKYREAGKLYCQAGEEYQKAGDDDMARSCFNISAECWGTVADLTSDDKHPQEKEEAVQKQVSALVKRASTYTAGSFDYGEKMKDAQKIWKEYRDKHPETKLDLDKHDC